MMLDGKNMLYLYIQARILTRAAGKPLWSYS